MDARAARRERRRSQSSESSGSRSRSRETMSPAALGSRPGGTKAPFAYVFRALDLLRSPPPRAPKGCRHLQTGWRSFGARAPLFSLPSGRSGAREAAEPCPSVIPGQAKPLSADPGESCTALIRGVCDAHYAGSRIALANRPCGAWLRHDGRGEVSGELGDAWRRGRMAAAGIATATRRARATELARRFIASAAGLPRVCVLKRCRRKKRCLGAGLVCLHHTRGFCASAMPRR